MEAVLKMANLAKLASQATHHIINKHLWLIMTNKIQLIKFYKIFTTPTILALRVS